MNKVDSPTFWENIYLDNDAGWDLDGVTPVFEQLSHSLTKGTICIVGCGRGYDAVQFAIQGFNVTAVDFAPTAIADLRKLAKSASVQIEILQTDIFSLPETHAFTFDYLIEQTCFCAIHPSRRKEYESLANTILKPNGKLIGLWFPLNKTPEEGGPPWGTTIEEVKSLFNYGWKIEKEEWPDLSISPRKDREKLIIFNKS